jgi:hypothetical protein
MARRVSALKSEHQQCGGRDGGNQSDQLERSEVLNSGNRHRWNHEFAQHQQAEANRRLWGLRNTVIQFASKRYAQHSSIRCVSGRRNQGSLSFNYFRRPCNHPNLCAAVEIPERCVIKTLRSSQDGQDMIVRFKVARSVQSRCQARRPLPTSRLHRTNPAVEAGYLSGSRPSGSYRLSSAL